MLELCPISIEIGQDWERVWGMHTFISYSSCPLSTACRFPASVDLPQALKILFTEQSTFFK